MFGTYIEAFVPCQHYNHGEVCQGMEDGGYKYNTFGTIHRKSSFDAISII